MKKLFLIPVMMCAFTMAACGQNNIALADNSNAIIKIDAMEKSYSNDNNVSSEVQKLKTEFMKEIKQQYFIDNDLEVPSSLEIILINNLYGTIYAYFLYDTRKINLIKKDKYGEIFVGSTEGVFRKLPLKAKKNIIYQK